MNRHANLTTYDDDDWMGFGRRSVLLKGRMRRDSIRDFLTLSLTHKHREEDMCKERIPSAVDLRDVQNEMLHSFETKATFDEF